jgi:hypothetical protein
MRTYSRAFWTLYPLGAELTWTFVCQRLDAGRISLSNASSIFLEYFTSLLGNLMPLFRDSVIQSFLKGSLLAQASVCFKVGLSAFALLLCGLPIAIACLVALLLFLTFIWWPIWLLIIIGSFVLWVCFYRYPVFEIVLPRLRTQMLINNSRVYSTIPPGPPTIRVVRLKSGNTGDTLDCKLITGLLAEMEYEALSYVWGVTIARYEIQMDGKSFLVPFNLHSALVQLRLPDRDRLIWIDALCINQSDNKEKGLQVQMMRDIYKSASRTIIWLGQVNVPVLTSATFEFVKHIGSTIAKDRDKIWNERAKYPRRWRKIRKELSNVLEAEWWRRAWIIQEVVVSKIVVVQRGPYQVTWDEFHGLLAIPTFGVEFPQSRATIQFVKDVQALRSHIETDGAPVGFLLDLVYRFRRQTATLGSDNIYALMGLLEATNSCLLVPDYGKTAEEVFMQFTISCLQHGASLKVLSLAAGTEVHNMTWCRDWRLDLDGMSGAPAFCRDTPLGRHYSASGSQPPSFDVDIQRRVLSLKGYVVDTVKQVSTLYLGGLSLVRWEKFAGGPWAAVSEEGQCFGRTVTANKWDSDCSDLRERLADEYRSYLTEGELVAYQKVVSDACHARRFFVTDHGRFGLGPWKAKKGDTVCILLGGETPFLLRRTECPKKTRRADEENNMPRVYHGLVGEAYVDGLMYYEGSMEEDIVFGKIVPEWFHLL